MHRRDREDAVDGILERLLRVDRTGCARLQTKQRGNGLQVVLDTVVDLLGEDAAHDGAPVLEGDGGLLRDRGEQLAVVLGERRGPVCNQLADLTSAPAQRLPDRVRVRAPLRPRDLAVLEHESSARRRQRVHRRLHDRLERLFEVEGVGDGLRDPRERLQLVHAPLRLGVELRVLDRLRHLRGDREQELDLVVGELARLAGAQVERAFEPLPAREDRDGEDRLVLVLGQVRKILEPRVEMRLARDGNRRPRLGR